MIYENPIAAAHELCELLAGEFDGSLIVGNSIKNIPFLDELAKGLKCPYELLFNKGIYAPAGGAQIAKISETREVVRVRELIDSFAISEEYLRSMSKLLYDENITPKINYFRAGKAFSDVRGVDCVVADQGCNTGLSALLCAKSLLNLGAKSVKYLTAVIAKDAYEYLSEYFDKVYYLQISEHFVNKDFYYEQSLDIRPELALEILEDSEFYLPFLKEKNENQYQ